MITTIEISQHGEPSLDSLSTLITNQLNAMLSKILNNGSRILQIQIQLRIQEAYAKVNQTMEVLNNLLEQNKSMLEQ